MAPADARPETGITGGGLASYRASRAHGLSWRSHPVNTFAVPGPPFAGPGAWARLLGRDEEKNRVERFLDGLTTGPAALVVVGEPGIGKTTLWEHGVAQARDRGYRVLAIRPTSDDRGRPAGALVELLGRDAGHEDVLTASATPAFDRG